MPPVPSPASPPGNIVLAWNNIYLDVVRHVGGAPGPLARIGALMHLAMYEAANRLGKGKYPSFVPVSAPPGAATAVLTAAYAACFTLTNGLQEYVDEALKMQGGAPNPFDPFQVTTGAMAHALTLTVAGSSNPSEDAASKAFGKAIAEAIATLYPPTAGLDMTVTPPLRQPGEPQQEGEWRETGSGTALNPQWGKLSLFLLATGSDAYLPTMPAGLDTYPGLLQSPVYAAQVAEVKLLGEARSAARTPEQTEIAFFWANDANGTSKPPGQLYTIVQTLAKQRGTRNAPNARVIDDLVETARLFGMVGMAMANASVVAWHAKYFWPSEKQPVRLWRPETAIHHAQAVSTPYVNPSTAADPSWQPLSAMTNGTRFSPNFPAFVSGHSTFAAAFAAAMRTFFGRDDLPFTATTEDPHAARDENGVRRTRSFASFTQAALENGRSRVYLGVHYQFDATGGYEIGTRVGTDTASRFTTPSPAPAK